MADMKQLEEKAQSALMAMSFAVWGIQMAGSLASDLEYLYTDIEFNNCYADKNVTKITAELTINTWNGGERKQYHVTYTQAPDKISSNDLKQYIQALYPDVDFESVGNGYEMTYREPMYESEYEYECKQPYKWQEYELLYA